MKIRIRKMIRSKSRSKGRISQENTPTVSSDSGVLMSAHVQCQCGHLAQYANDPGTPYNYDPATDTYSLKLSDAVIVADVYCHWCGGHPPFKHPKGWPFCQCKFLERCERDPALPIEISGTGNSFDPVYPRG
jgi:hypothetical protein